jgi:predicted ATPase/DNA-binding CsgD family transcriptional regulator
MITDTSPGSGNLPAEPNSFVGRERDLTELAGLLGQVRALTLCGPGGIGKTRLALRLAWELVPDYPDGAWLAELGDTDDPERVPARVATALGIRPEPGRPVTDTLADALRPRRMILILDTCEHVVGACAALAHQLLAACPAVRLIATSREPLRVRGETAWRVPPLAVPAQFGELSEADLAEHEAIRLFAERAAAVRPGFRLTGENIGAAVRLCRTLDGIPLAIELAAARVRALSVEQIDTRLSDRFQLLASGDRTAPPRQQTLQAAVDWSYELLTGPEQILLRRLSVFAGWNLETAEQVCAGDGIAPEEVLPLLAALIDKSLVTLDAEVAATARYRLLDTIRQYAASALAASGEQTAIRRRHRDCLLDLVEAAAAVAFVRGDPPWAARVELYQRIHAERANFTAALQTSLELREAAAGLRLCCALRTPWATHGDVSEGLAWLEKFLALDTGVPAGLRIQAVTAQAELAFTHEDYGTAAAAANRSVDLARLAGLPPGPGAVRLLALISLRERRPEEAARGVREAVDLARAAADPWEEGLAQVSLAAVLARAGDLGGAQVAYTAALAVLQDNNGWGIALAHHGLGWLAMARQDRAAALDSFGTALELYRQIDARPEVARSLAGAGWARLATGDLEQARVSLTESARLALALGQRLAIARSLTALGVLALAEGDDERGIRLEGAAAALSELLGRLQPAGASHRLDGIFEAARQRAGAAASAGLLAQGRAMTAPDAIRYGMSPPGTAPQPLRRAAGPAVPPAAPGPALTERPVLTPRELQTALLVGRGLSNKAIADELVISPATAARHVANIFTKLGFTSRAQLAAWVAGRAREPGGTG